MSGAWRAALAAAALLSLAACAGPRTPDEIARVAETNDPNESLNRAIFAFNQGLDVVVLRPLAVWYRFLVPLPAMRDTVRRVIDNAALPWTMVNELLQGEYAAAGVSSTRFLINTTLGLGGTIDWATRWGYPHHSEDFGLTLARRYGVGEGPYSMLFGLGPRTRRDAYAVWLDIVGNPIGYLLPFDTIDMRSRRLEDLDRLRRESSDFYATVRSTVRQHRQAEVDRGEVPVDDVPRVTNDEASPAPALTNSDNDAAAARLGR